MGKPNPVRLWKMTSGVGRYPTTMHASILASLLVHGARLEDTTQLCRTSRCARVWFAELIMETGRCVDGFV
jgi:hypothetical protein